jgi:two-component system chemotaxis sensor kinase CheA
VLDRIFEQGVSVRDVATEISGRGVGLDVVAKEIAAIGGSVAVESTTGAGTRFMLTVPTKLEADVVVPLLSLGQTYAVSARAVVTVRRVEVLEDTAHGPMMRVGGDDGSLVPVHALSSVVQGRGKSRVDDVAVILRHRSGEVALTLDAVQNPRPITFQRTEELAFRSTIVRGVGVLPDGGTIQLLDVEALAGVTRRAGVSVVEATAGEAHALVVEDAPVARELLVGLLRSFGLRVTEAVDGRDGLARALSDRPDIVLTDLEMPYLDGLALISRLRHEPSTAGVPIVVLTTRSDPETEARARALGVRAFLSKHRFVEDRLREVVDACLERR